MTPQTLVSAARYGWPSLVMWKVSRLSSIAQVRVSTMAVRVEKSVPAYESPLTKTVQATR
ncbi:hypothetical protein SALBM311S_10221 [Streptomyces alboniger]